MLGRKKVFRQFSLKLCLIYLLKTLILEVVLARDAAGTSSLRCIAFDYSFPFRWLALSYTKLCWGFLFFYVLMV